MLKLLQPIQLGPYLLPNRVVLSPMTRNRSPGEVPNDLNALYYAQRAGAGLVMTESTAISPRGLGWTETPGIWSADQVRGWQKVTQAVHARGGRIYVQLWHCGRNSHPLTQPGGQVPLGPSAVQPTGTVRTREGRLPLHVPREMDTRDISELLDEYRHAARMAQEAGFDGVEVHAANGYLLDQFLRDSANLRRDDYGGSPERRCRLLFEVVQAVAETWGADRMGVRLSPTSPSNYRLSDSEPAALYAVALQGLSKLRVAFVDMVEGSSNAMPPTHDLDWDALRRHFSGVYIANNAFTRESGEEAIASGRADMVAFGRLFIANPDLVRRFADGAPLNPLVQDTIYTSDHRGYTDYPSLDGDGRKTHS
ncbi:MAG TPA: alkene reductase [Ramlibacter sp.]|uniref:alkene reductase n=1 Tax=Ramlibacter sp. TaxID=1917967 RepID=UPI002ED41533